MTERMIPKPGQKFNAFIKQGFHSKSYAGREMAGKPHLHNPFIAEKVNVYQGYKRIKGQESRQKEYRVTAGSFKLASTMWVFTGVEK